ncbi:hypothetical protein RCH12_000457 [Cryobacterium sp. MP_3.1]|uniref:O-antigen ligase family protein n=1 Tax=Cryobacterium sp. MP_3.1 TaxID=3071711 RepID=UPI002E083F4D|nr:hypothetical protein [Cryobacterium sp. MP_3.1]
MPNVVQFHLGYRPSAQLGESYSLVPIASLSKSILQFAVYAFSALTVLQALIGRTHYRKWFLVYLAPWVALSLSSLLATQSFTATSLVYVAMGLGIANHEDKMALLRALGGLTALLAMVSLVMVATTPNALMSQAHLADAKALVGTSLLNGPFSHPNTLGQTLAIGFPFVLMIKRRWMRILGVASVALALVWASSRTSILAVVIAVVVGLGWVAVKQLGRFEKVAVGLPLLTVYALIVPVAIVLVGIAGPDSFSNRGVIWETSLNLWADRPVWGWGSDVYGSLSQSMRNIGVLAFHGHNMLVNALAVGGLVSAAALLVLYVVIIRKSWVQGYREHNIAVSMFAVVFISIGWFEVPTTFYTLGATSWVAWAAVGLVLALPRALSVPGGPDLLPATLDGRRT